MKPVESWCPKGPDKRGPYSGLWACHIGATRRSAWANITRALGETHHALYRGGWRVIRVVVEEAKP